jgi:hypothetical protein
MAPERWLARAYRVLLFAALPALFAVPPAGALRLLDYNILNYPGSTASTRNPYFRTIIAAIAPDLIVTEEMDSATGVDQFLASLNVMEPGQWAAPVPADGGDVDAQVATHQQVVVGHGGHRPVV